MDELAFSSVSRSKSRDSNLCIRLKEIGKGGGGLGSEEKMKMITGRRIKATSTNWPPDNDYPSNR